MNKESLEKRKAEIQSKYNELETEMKRLEGEFRLVQQLIDHDVEEVPKQVKRIRKVVDDAPTE